MAKETFVWTVDEITQRIKSLLEEDKELEDVRVRGEISNFSRRQGNLFFSLKGKESLLRCVMFSRWTSELDFEPEDGLEVEARGSIGVYKPQGRYQLYVMELYSLLGKKGALYLALERLKRKLAREGYFEPSRKRPLPFLPQRIGIVTSPDGAAIRDMLTVLNRRFPNLHIILSPCRVQGDYAAEEIAQALENLNLYGGVDVVIVGRGGGSLEDLFPFNEEVVARAIYNSRFPVISAVGHEIDFTISDLVADERAPTPTAAAERVVPKKKDLIEDLWRRKNRIVDLMRRRVEFAKNEWEKVRAFSHFRKPERIFFDLRTKLEERRRELLSGLFHQGKIERERIGGILRALLSLSPRQKLKSAQEKLKREEESLKSSFSRYLRRKEERLEGFKKRVNDLSPLAVLQRGYSICFTYPEGEIVREHHQVKEGERLRVKVWRGEIYSKVERTQGEIK